MLTFAKAREVAEAWVSANTRHEGELLDNETIAKPYGWVFFYQSKDFIRDPSKTSARFAGNGPFLVRRVNGDVHAFGTAMPIAAQLAEYERQQTESEIPVTSDPSKYDSA